MSFNKDDQERLINNYTAFFPYFVAVSGPMADIEFGDEIKTAKDEEREVKTCATNGRAIVLNPEYMATLSPQEQSFTLCQMALGIARRQHLLRGSRDPKIWSEACAHCRVHEINAWIEDCKESGKNARVSIPDGIKIDNRFKDMDEIEIYEILEQENKDRGSNGNNNGAKGGSVEGAGQVVDSTGFGDNPVMNEQHIQKESSEIGQNLRMAEARAKMAGDGSGYWGKLADNADDHGPDPERMLNRFVTNSFPTDRSWKSPDPRYLAMGQYYPAEVKDNIGEIVVALDCSGSMDRQDIAELLGWVHNACQACHPEKIHVIYFTGAIERHDEFDWNEEFEVPDDIPNGGTCFRTVRNYIDDLNLNAQCEIWMTDGYDSFPEPPARPILWMMTTDVEPTYGERWDFYSKRKQYA